MISARSLLLVALLALYSFAGPSYARDGGWDSVGFRGGFSETAGKDSSNRYTLNQYELFAGYRLPWELRASSGWGIGTKVDMAAGMLSGAGDVGLIASAGPAFPFGKPGFPLELEAGVSAAFLSRDDFGNRDYNGHVQFISHGGLCYRFDRVGVAYRFNHMSNAGLNGRHNPGVNVHMFGISWYFTD